MLASLAKAPPAGNGGWIYERKFDGLRAVAVRNGDEVELWSRGHLPYNQRFGGIVAELGELPVDNFTLDGEIVAYQGDRTSFGLLQQPGSTATPVYVVFDVMHLLGQDTTPLPLADRRRLVAGFVEPSLTLRLVEEIAGEPATLLAKACADGWEGLIAKRSGGPYRPGRSSDWRKLKCDACEELVIGGWTDPQGTRTGFGAVLVGYYDDEGKLRYAGKVGTGFDEATLEDLRERLSRLERSEPAFDDVPRMKNAHWVEPELVANVAFTEWTADGRLRHPRYQGLRPDKKPSEVRRELPTL